MNAQKLHHFFETSDSKPAVFYHFFIILLIILSAGLALLELISPLSIARFSKFAPYFEVAVLGIFTIEYALRFTVAPQKLRFVVNIFNLIDLLSIVPFYLGISNTVYLRLFRLLRFLRLLKFLRIYETLQFRGTVLERITPFIAMLLAIKIIIWILEFKGYWIGKFDLGILFTIIGFSLGIVLSQKISKTYDKLFLIRKSMFDLHGRLAGMRYFMNAIRKGSGTKAIRRWLSEYLILYEKSASNTTERLDKINQELYQCILQLGNRPLIPQNRLAALVKDIFVDANFVLSKRDAYTPEAYDKLLHQITLLYLFSLIIFIPGVTGLISILFASYMLYGLFYVTQDLDLAASSDRSSLIKLEPEKLKDYLRMLDSTK